MQGMWWLAWTGDTNIFLFEEILEESKVTELFFRRTLDNSYLSYKNQIKKLNQTLNQTKNIWKKTII